MWLRHWKLDRDPFARVGSPFVATPGHGEAVARIAHAIESGWRSAALHAPAGLGKTRVLAEALGRVRSPARRIVRVENPTDGPSLLADLAGRLDAPIPADSARSVAWRRLDEAVRLCHCQGLHVVLAIDDTQDLGGPADRLDLRRLSRLGARAGGPLTVLTIGREPSDDLDDSEDDDWDLAIRLAPLTRSEAGQYLAAKLAAAGRRSPVFAPKAVTRLHAIARGVPAGLERLATLALLAGSFEGLEVVTPEVVEGAAGECLAREIEAG